MSVLSLDLFWAVPVGVFIAGLLASPHCLAMCGPLAFSFARNKHTFALYQVGRAMSYTAAGAIAGSIGHGLLNQLQLPSVSYFALTALSLVLFFMAFRAFQGKSPSHVQLPQTVRSLTGKIFKLLPKLPPGLGALLGGATTVLLPCGHLYGFLVGAAATGSVYGGAAFMFAFWLGTVPALSLSPLLIRYASQRVQFGPRVAGFILVCTGLISVASFANRVAKIEKPPVAEQTQPKHSCH